jgi:hypothetical protein
VNLLEIKTDAASYLSVAVADLTVNGQDLWLSAANRVRRRIEQVHNLEFTRQLVELDLDGVTGGSLDDAVLYGTATTVNVKSPIEVGLFDENGNLRPIAWTTVSASLEEQRKEYPGFLPRYPTDGEIISPVCGEQRVTFANRNVYLFPNQANFTLTVGIEAYTFQNDWVAGNLSGTPITDTWTTQGADILLWGTVVQLNYHFKEFVPRQEGNLSAPEKLRDEAIAAFLNWDIFSYEQFRRHG